MKEREEKDRRIRRMFSAAREAEAGAAPGFHEIVNRERADGRARTARPGSRRSPFPAAAAGFAGLVLASAWLLHSALQHAPVQIAEQRASATPASPPPSAPVTVAKPPASLDSVEPRTAPLAAIPEPAAPEPPRREPAPQLSRDDLAELAAVDYSVAPASGATEARPGPDAMAAGGEKNVALPVQVSEKSGEVPVAAESALDVNQPGAPKRNGDGLIASLPAAGLFYQNVITRAPGVQDADGDGKATLHGSRARDFQMRVGGVSNVDPSTGEYLSRVNPNSIEEMDDLLGHDRYRGDFNTEEYDRIVENEFLAVVDNPLSTFSIDVDTASYSNLRRFFEAGQKPPRDAVRIEELINYFRYDYPEPAGDAPFSVSADVAGCPWNAAHRLVRIGLKGREIARGETAGSNLVFLIDVSGSMAAENKLPLLKRSLALLVDELGGRDQVAIVVYAGASGLVLPSTSGSDKQRILDALERLDAGGSTNGGAGLARAYKVARENFIRGGVNRVILATDGDFNVGVTGRAELLSLIEEDARKGIFLSVLGFGMGNYQDGMLEMLTGKGNGNYAYIDGLAEARKVLVEQMSGTLVAIAKDVKIQVEFNPREVGAYRLIGYENRVLAKEDFNDDRKDAGEIGAGHTVTALYEIVPAGSREAGEVAREIDPLKYQAPVGPTEAAGGGETLTVKLRYKEPDEDTSRLLSVPVVDGGSTLESAAPDFKFAAAVAEFGMLLRESAQRGAASFEQVLALSREGRGADEGGYRKAFHGLVLRASAIE